VRKGREETTLRKDSAFSSSSEVEAVPVLDKFRFSIALKFGASKFRCKLIVRESFDQPAVFQFEILG
jgi:hypothetical protein